MRAHQRAKRILVLSDDDRLAKAIGVNLDGLHQIEAVQRSVPASGPATSGRDATDVDLLVVATSSPCSEPVALLAEASLLGRVGQVPLLIISDRPFPGVPESKIAHLHFPFLPEELQEKVHHLLMEA